MGAGSEAIALRDACDLPPGARLLELAATDIAGLIADIRAVADGRRRRAQFAHLSLVKATRLSWGDLDAMFSAEPVNRGRPTRA